MSCEIIEAQARGLVGGVGGGGDREVVKEVRLRTRAVVYKGAWPVATGFTTTTTLPT